MTYGRMTEAEVSHYIHKSASDFFPVKQYGDIADDAHMEIWQKLRKLIQEKGPLSHGQIGRFVKSRLIDICRRQKNPGERAFKYCGGLHDIDEIETIEGSRRQSPFPDMDDVAQVSILRDRFMELTKTCPYTQERVQLFFAGQSQADIATHFKEKYGHPFKGQQLFHDALMQIREEEASR